MILYTYQSEQSIFPPQSADYTSCKTVQVQGGYVMLEKSGESYYVSRLLSTDPNMYLDSRFTPGQRFEP